MQGLMASGQVVPLLALTEAPTEAFPKVPGLKDFDLAADDAPGYAVYCHNDASPAPVQALSQCIKAACQSPQWAEFCRKHGCELPVFPDINQQE
ncbi:MAG: hypothetical protein Q4C54_10485 [Clostridia bacterium]|nr:hypothetical protein [Clostridia bacterium]